MGVMDRLVLNDEQWEGMMYRNCCLIRVPYFDIPTGPEEQGGDEGIIRIRALEDGGSIWLEYIVRTDRTVSTASQS